MLHTFFSLHLCNWFFGREVYCPGCRQGETNPAVLLRSRDDVFGHHGAAQRNLATLGRLWAFCSETSSTEQPSSVEFKRTNKLKARVTTLAQLLSSCSGRGVRAEEAPHSLLLGSTGKHSAAAKIEKLCSKRNGEFLKFTSLRQRAPLKTTFHMQLEAGEEEETCYPIWHSSTGGKAITANQQRLC